MTKISRLALVIILLSFPLLSPVLAEQARQRSADTLISHAIHQIKTALIKQLSPRDIENLIDQVRRLGGTGYKLNRYGSGKLGWSIRDSKDRDVYFIIFSFVDHRANEGTYLGPLMSLRHAREVHTWHEEALSKNFRQIAKDKYDIGDNCMASMELFKDTSGAGQTKIAIKCN